MQLEMNELSGGCAVHGYSVQIRGASEIHRRCDGILALAGSYLGR
jgi:hypothetical protein